MAEGSAQCSNQRVQTHSTPISTADSLSQSSQASPSPPSQDPAITRHFSYSAVVQSCNSLARANFLSKSSSMASCVMPLSATVAVAGTAAVAGAPRKAQAQTNARLSSRSASTISGVALPTLARPAFRTEAKRSLTIVAAKATKDAESSVNEASAVAEDFLRSLQKAWEKSDDKPAIAGLGFAGLIGIWASFGLINAIEKLPLIPDLFEIVGILFTGWFSYRYLFFKPNREELLKLIDEAKAKITGQ